MLYPFPSAIGSILVAADIWFVFRTTDIDSAPFRITVSVPEGQPIAAECDLAPYNKFLLSSVRTPKLSPLSYFVLGTLCSPSNLSYALLPWLIP
jgi:hypothetical protein